MASATYIEHDGSTHTVDVAIGTSLKDGSVRHNLPGIVAECGGMCSCATCHVYVDEAWMSRLEEPDPEESELVEFLDKYQPNSRLSCQILMAEELDGIVVRVPEYQG
jgi:2Fe-2S ferredoxin